MSAQIINIADVALQPPPPERTPTGETAERYGARMGLIAPLIGARQLGYNITAIAPGKRAFPFHNHQVNEEMFFILQGTGEIRIGAERFAVRQGDIIACPAGGPETAHQIINSGDEELRFLAVSTSLAPEIAEYPDTGRFGVLGSLGSAAAGNRRPLMYVGDEAESLDYWQGN